MKVVKEEDEFAIAGRTYNNNTSASRWQEKEEETVADSVAIHTTIKQITGRGGGRTTTTCYENRVLWYLLTVLTYQSHVTSL